MDITSHIRKLLGEYDYVVIPGLGGFVANYQSAERHPVTHQFYPPAKKLTFNRQLQNNDALLLHHLVEQEGLDQQEAKSYLQQFAADCNQRLDRQEVVKLEGIGKLFLDVERTLQFVQSSNNHLLAAYGLPAYQAEPVLRKQVVDTTPAVEQPVRSIAPERKKRVVWWPWAAVFIILMGLVTTFFTVPTVKQSTQQWFGYDTAIASSTAYAGMAIMPLVEKDLTAYYPLEIPVQVNGTVSFTIDVNTLEQPLAVSNNGTIPKGYFVIVGSFTQQQNANTLYRDLQMAGFEAYIFPEANNGFTRVGIYASGHSLIEANKEVAQVRHDFQPDAWIIKNIGE